MAERSYLSTEATLWGSIKSETLSTTYNKDEIWNLFQKLIKELARDTVTLEEKIVEITPAETIPEQRKRREQRKEERRKEGGRKEGGRK